MRKLLSSITCLLFLVASATAQSKLVTGRITDSTGNPISGASVRIKGIKKGTSAANDGSFRIAVPPQATLEISAIGFDPREIDVRNSADVSVQLHAAGSKVLNEVVVTALGIRRDKRDLTYSTQEVKGDVLVAAKQDNIINGLAGKLSGVQITNSTGMPGSSARIVIRGATSLVGENQPLFIVDGIPIDNTEAGAIDALGQGADNVALNQGSTSNRGIDIDPNIIETVTVLKGAAATAIYGSQAARGAIVITTRNGIRGAKPLVSVSSSYSMENPIYLPIQHIYAQGLDGQYIDGNNGGKASYSWGPRIDTLRVNGKPVQIHDPQKEFFHTGHTTDNNISVSGATDRSKYLISYSYLNTNGIIPTTNFARHSIFGKFSNQITSKITANIQVNYVSSVNHRTEEGNGLSSPMWTLFSAPISWNPLPAVEPDGSQNLYRNGRNNPYFLLDNTGFVSTVNRFLPVASIVYNPLPWLSITERIGGDLYTDESSYHESNQVVNGYFSNSGGVTNRTETFRQFNHDLIIEAHKDLSDNLFGAITLGNNIFSQHIETYNQTGLGQSVANFYNIATMSTQTATDNLSIYRKVGYYAQANLEYKKMLNLSLTGRIDGSSVLAVNKSYYPYGSAALGFIFTELMTPNNTLPFGKVRVSYSAVGNDNLSPYSLSTPFLAAGGTANNIIYPFNGQTAYLLSDILGNSALKNESLDEFEVGLELKFLHNRISLEGSYFDRKTKDLLTPTPINPSSGFYKDVLNAGSMEDKGIELLVNATPIRNRDFSWDISVNFTRIRNKVISLAPNVNNLQFGGFGGGGGVYAFAGKPYGVLYGSTYLRDAKGNIEVDDSGLPLTGANGQVGNTQADFLAGTTNTFTYKALSLSFLFDWHQGGDAFNYDDHYNWYYGTPKVTGNNGRAPFVVPGVYQSSGKVNTTLVRPQDYYQIISSIDESVIEKATYIKLRSVVLSYTLRQPTLKKSPFKSLTITVSGNNLWIYNPFFTGSDPEASLGGSGNGQGIVNFLAPTSRSFIAGLRASF
jgi:TonB-linked SusC/RagA family outer membrane protein